FLPDPHYRLATSRSTAGTGRVHTIFSLRVKKSDTSMCVNGQPRTAAPAARSNKTPLQKRQSAPAASSAKTATFKKPLN
ncbi:hypothetical protein, partial [Cupriavidus sp. YAF13]|uniref:hypothetical protein n=1 Tax=Cupriavidus sp. YAF13 TaxID=3233075 RepID=UPI003F90CF16